MDGTQFLFLPWFPEKSGGGYKIMKNTVCIMEIFNFMWLAYLGQLPWVPTKPKKNLFVFPLK